MPADFEERLGRAELGAPPRYGQDFERTAPRSPVDAPPPAGSVAALGLAAQRRRIARNLAREAAAAERERAAEGAELERQHQLWRDNTEARERALTELAVLDAELAELRHRVLALGERRGDLVAIVRIGQQP